MDCGPPGSSVYGILQARMLEWVAIPFSRDLPDPGIKPGSPTLLADSLPSESLGKPRIVELILSPGDLPDQRIKLGSPALQADSLPTDLPGKPFIFLY